MRTQGALQFGVLVFPGNDISSLKTRSQRRQENFKSLGITPSRNLWAEHGGNDHRVKNKGTSYLQGGTQVCGPALK